MPIRILPPEIASQIAAGEVVERPASVVKELIENALDAGATHIAVKVAGAGKKLIEIADNGNGIPADGLPLAVERHATSKLSSAEDLFRITTLGFRGEALSSIGSVSRMSIISRVADADEGMQLNVDGGKVTGINAVGAPLGTQVRVEDLFYNVPARLKFLKSDTTERRHINTLVTHYALAYPQVRFELLQDNRSVLQTSGNGDRREILATMYGVETARQMLEVIALKDDIHIEGFTSPTSVTRSNRREMLFFVNGRPVHDPSLNAAIMRGYHTLLMVGRYPIVVLFLRMPPEEVDVNVHPTKAEVRFQYKDRVFVAVQGAVRKALLAHSPVPGISPTLHWTPDSTGDDFVSVQSGNTNFTSANRWETENEYHQSPATQTSLPDGHVPILRLIGQVAAAYLVAEGPDGLYLIDQHAAHERVLFERFMQQRQSEIPAQSLLQPVVVTLSPGSAQLLEAQLPILDNLGFKVEAFGPNTFQVRAVPSMLGDIDPEAALRVIVEDFEEDETPLQAEVEARIIARVCKRAAVKAGQTLSREEQSALLRDLEACQSPRTCPHGRPTMIHLSVDLLERQFGRRGAR
jgi:DNA mismatch repair protein MutL